MKRIYVSSSWRNPIHSKVVSILSELGYSVYDFKNPHFGYHGFSWSQIDLNWLKWTTEKYKEIISDIENYPIIKYGFETDKEALDWCDICICLLPCGRSSHLEAGYCIGKSKPTLFYLHPDNFEPELMYLLGYCCVTSIDELIEELKEIN